MPDYWKRSALTASRPFPAAYFGCAVELCIRVLCLRTRKAGGIMQAGFPRREHRMPTRSHLFCTLAVMYAILASSRERGHAGMHLCAPPPLSQRSHHERRYDQSRHTTLQVPQYAVSPLFISARPHLQRPLPCDQRANRRHGAQW